MTALDFPVFDETDTDTIERPVVPEEPEVPNKRSWLRTVIAVTLIAGAAITISTVVKSTFITPFRIPSESMHPTLTNGDRILVNRLSYKVGSGPERGDVVVFEAPPVLAAAGYTDLVKRVIGEPGDTLKFLDCAVFVNGTELTEDYIDGTCTEPPGNDVDPNLDGVVQVPAGTVFVMGDNRNDGQSYDSRFWGPLDVDQIVGRAFFIYWPGSDVGTI